MESNGLATRSLLPRPNATRSFGERVVLAFVFGIPLIYALLFVLTWNHVGPRDFDQFIVFHELQLWNSQLFGLAKQWSPVLCSGVSLAGEPQVPFMSLSMLLTYGLGPLRGLQLATVIYFVAGWAGAYLYAGLWLGHTRTRALAAALFIGNGFFICRLAYGHMDFIPFLSLPLLLWAVHRTLDIRENATVFAMTVRVWLLALLIGGSVSLIIDGSPVAIIHLLFWVSVYALTLSVVVRSIWPVAILAGAICAAVFLSAGYLWSMLSAQAEYPRLMPDTFTNPVALLWFVLLPVRGKFIVPATGNGHELSVFIGPVIAYAIWRFRDSLLPTLPVTLKWPLLIVSVVSIWLGMGSLHVLNLPKLLSPFDWLRPLPGFRSLWVTGRFWGFLCLPLSLLGAAALEKLAQDETLRRARLWFVSAVLLQFGFQVFTLADQWSDGHPYKAIDARALFSPKGESISYKRCDQQHYQGEFITPRDGVINCYDNDEFVRVPFDPGSALIATSQDARGASLDLAALQPVFLTWNRIHIDVDQSKIALAANQPFTLILNQAYNPHWQSRECAVFKQEHGNLAMTCKPDGLRLGAIDLEFVDPVSDLGVRVSALAWKVWASIVLVLSSLGLWHAIKRNEKRLREVGALPTGLAQRRHADELDKSSQ